MCRAYLAVLCLLAAIAAGARAQDVAISVRYEDGSREAYGALDPSTEELSLSAWSLADRGLSVSMDNRIVSIDGMELLPGLRRLSFVNLAAIADFSFLSGLGQVEELAISLCVVPDVAFLRGMAGLREVRLSENLRGFPAAAGVAAGGGGAGSNVVDAGGGSGAGEVQTDGSGEPLAVDLGGNPKLEFFAVEVVSGLPVFRGVPGSLRVIQIVGEYGLEIAYDDPGLAGLSGVPLVFLSSCAISDRLRRMMPNLSTAYLTPVEIDELVADIRAGIQIDSIRPIE